MKQLSIFDFMDEPKKEIAPVVIELDADELWCKSRGISIYNNGARTIAEHSRCTCRSAADTVAVFESFGLNVKQPISYAAFNRWCVNCGIGFRAEHARAERDFELIREFEDTDGHRLITFANREFPVYCMGNKTFDGVDVVKVVA